MSSILSIGFLGKFMCLFMNLDAMVGPKFEQGLAGIKREAEL